MNNAELSDLLKGQNLTELSKKTGLSRGTLNRVRKGEEVSFSNALKVMDALGLELSVRPARLSSALYKGLNSYFGANFMLSKEEECTPNLSRKDVLRLALEAAKEDGRVMNALVTTFSHLSTRELQDTYLFHTSDCQLLGYLLDASNEVNGKKSHGKFINMLKKDYPMRKLDGKVLQGRSLERALEHMKLTGAAVAMRWNVYDTSYSDQSRSSATS